MRWKQHCVDARRGSGYVFHKAIRRHGEQSFTHILLETCVNVPERIAGEREAYWIDKLNTTTAGHGYNMTLGGISRLTVWTDEMKELHRRRTSEGTKRAFQNPTIKARHLKATRIARNRPLAIQHNREVQKEVWKRHGYREMMCKQRVSSWQNPSPMQLKRFKPIAQIDVQTGKKLNIFMSAHAAARKLGLSQGSISNVARGVTKTAGGFRWKYVNDAKDFNLIPTHE